MNTNQHNNAKRKIIYPKHQVVPRQNQPTQPIKKSQSFIRRKAPQQEAYQQLNDKNLEPTINNSALQHTAYNQNIPKLTMQTPQCNSMTTLETAMNDPHINSSLATFNSEKHTQPSGRDKSQPTQTMQRSKAQSQIRIPTPQKVQIQNPYSGQQSDYNVSQMLKAYNSQVQSNKLSNRSGNNSQPAVKRQKVSSGFISSRQISDRSQEHLTKIRFKQPIVVKQQKIMESLPKDLKTALERNLPKFRLNLPTQQLKVGESATGGVKLLDSRNKDAQPHKVGQEMQQTFGRQDQRINKQQMPEQKLRQSILNSQQQPEQYQKQPKPSQEAEELQKQIEIAFGSETSQREIQDRTLKNGASGNQSSRVRFEELAGVKMHALDRLVNFEAVDTANIVDQIAQSWRHQDLPQQITDSQKLVAQTSQIQLQNQSSNKLPLNSQSEQVIDQKQNKTIKDNKLKKDLKVVTEENENALSRSLNEKEFKKISVKRLDKDKFEKSMSPAHNKSLSLSEMEESVKKFYPDATLIYNAGFRLTPQEINKPNFGVVSDQDAGEGYQKSAIKEGLKQALEASREELHKVASEAMLGQGHTRGMNSSSNLGKSELIGQIMGGEQPTSGS